MRRFLWALTFLTGTPALLIWSFLLLNSISPAHPPVPQVLGASIQADPANLADVPQVSTSAIPADGRFYIIKNYLHQYSSPLEPYAGLIIETSQKYDLDYRLLVAIAQQESNLCKKIPENSYNCWGYGIYGDLVTRFPGYPQGIETVAKGLKKNYIDKGLHTPNQIMAKYTPPSLEKGGPWAKAVDQFLADLE